MRSILKVVLLSLFPIASIASETSLDLGDYIGRIFSDGSGTIGAPDDVNNYIDTWSFRIKNDEMTDEKIITVNRYAYTNSEEFGKIQLQYEIWLFINLSKTNKEILCIGGHDYPGKTGMIRIDKNAPITTDVNGCLRLNKKLDKQLRSGNKITLRGYNWPYEGGETKTINLNGYIATSEFLRSKR